MHTDHRSLFLLLALGLLLPAVVPAAKTPLAGIPLVWKPTTPVSEYGAVNLTGVAGVKIEVRALRDAREKPDLIGENRDKEDEGIVLTVTTGDDAARFVTDNLKRVWSDAGLDLVDTGGDVVVTGELKRFFVLETSTYAGEVNLRIEVKDRAGKVLWAGMAAGTAKRFGGSYKSENYYETLSDALMDAAYKLLQNESFMRALSGKPQP
jgi:hypothetical protein